MKPKTFYRELYRQVFRAQKKDAIERLDVHARATIWNHVPADVLDELKAEVLDRIDKEAKSWKFKDIPEGVTLGVMQSTADGNLEFVQLEVPDGAKNPTSEMKVKEVAGQVVTPFVSTASARDQMQAMRRAMGLKTDQNLLEHSMAVVRWMLKHIAWGRVVGAIEEDNRGRLAAQLGVPTRFDDLTSDERAWVMGVIGELPESREIHE